MPKTTRPLNPVGIWLNNELGKRNILLSAFAGMVGINPQNLSYIMRNSDLSEETMQNWREKFKTVLLAQNNA